VNGVAEDEPVVVSVKDGIGTVRLNRPRQKNAVTAPMWETLHRTFIAFGADPAVRVVL
jgi:enoyl-CoA hydratase/carnithine racemase